MDNLVRDVEFAPVNIFPVSARQLFLNIPVSKSFMNNCTRRCVR